MASQSEVRAASQPDSAAARPAPRPLAALVDRFDRSVIDIPGGRTRIRLFVEALGSWDFVVDRIDSKLEPAAEHVEADALLLADAATWQRVAHDVRGGMPAYRERCLKIRKNLHLGVGFLAATSGVTGPGRLRFESIPTRRASISTLTAGVGEPIVCIHGL